METFSGADRSVLLRFRGRAFGDGTEDHEVTWPADWDLPRMGDAIRLRPDYAGIVQVVEYDLSAGRIVIGLR